jgi:hypothetical protein
MYPISVEHPDSLAAGTHTGTWYNLGSYHRAFLYVNVGDMAATATLDVGLQQASDETGTGAKAITGKTITQLTQAGGDGNDLVCIELQTEELDVDGGFEHVRWYATIANAAVEMAVTLFVCEPRYEPVPTANWTEIVP